MSKLSMISFLAYLLLFFSAANSLSTLKSTSSNSVVETDDSLYTSLLQFSIPSSTMKCSAAQSLLDLFQTAYSEASELKTASCVQSIFTTKITKLQTIINNNQCTNDQPVPTATPLYGDSVVWVIDKDQIAWFKEPSTGIWRKTYCSENNVQKMSWYIDKLPTSTGVYTWAIGPGNGPWWLQGTSQAFKRPGAWEVNGNLLMVRISPYDQSIWGITISYKVQYAKSNTATSYEILDLPSGITKARHIDVSPKDGTCYMVSSDYRVFYSSPNRQWAEITGLTVANLRVIANGYIFAIGTDNNAYYRAGNDGNWVFLEGEGSFVFLDVNNAGRIYALKSDNSVYSREYISGSWFNTNKSLQTFRVVDDGACYGVGLNDVSSGVGHVYVRNGTTDGVWTQIEENNGFAGAINLWGPSAYRTYYANRNLYYKIKAD